VSPVVDTYSLQLPGGTDKVLVPNKPSDEQRQPAQQTVSR
jgi:hypothetical protein